MKTQDRLMAWRHLRKSTLLGIGPMSRNCVDAAIELAHELEAPLTLIASRRQIEAAEFGGGYVNGWSTEEFVNYVRARDGGRLILARDHGGPWQAPFELSPPASADSAMRTAKKSYEVDIAAGFSAIHIDPSIAPGAAPTLETTLSRIYELYEHCYAVSRRLDREIIFEIGTDEQSEEFQDPQSLDYVLGSIVHYCNQNGLPRPTFVVAQTGTKTEGTGNVGVLEAQLLRSLTEGEGIPSHIRSMNQVCRQHGVLLKEHNADYLSETALMLHPALGIDAVNVAPEFGVAETRAFLKLLDSQGLRDLAWEFVRLAYESRKWQKWFASDTTATDIEKAVVAGHYIFASPDFTELKARAQAIVGPRGIQIDDRLRAAVKSSIGRYIKALGLGADAHHAAWTGLLGTT